MKERKRKGYEQREADKRIKRDQERREMSRKERKEASRKDKQKAKAKRARNKEFARVTYIFVALFLVLMGYITYFQVARSRDIIRSPYNARQDSYADRVVRGKILDKDGNVLTDTHITTDTEQGEVTIPVLKMKEVPITFEYTGVPQGYDTSVLGAQLSQETILIAGPAERVDALESVSAGFVDLTKFKLGETVTLSITLPEGIRNLDALQSVDVTFDTYGFATRTVTVSQITVVNAPSDTTVTVTTRRLSDVTLVGPEDELDALSEANVVAQVDASASNINVSKGQQSMPVTIVVPGSSTVFATGSYEVLCDIDTSEGAG